MLKTEKVDVILEEINGILAKLEQAEQSHSLQLEKVHPSFRASALNLIHYRSLRSTDLRSLQRKLGNLSLSRLAKAEGHVKASLLATQTILGALKGVPPGQRDKSTFSIKKGRKILNSHTKELLGFRSKGRRVRIMVTLPTEAASNYSLVESLLASGMNTARINCAHDSPMEWLMMIENLHKAKLRLKKICKISMDLAGPKIRTGDMIQGPPGQTF